MNMFSLFNGKSKCNFDQLLVEIPLRSSPPDEGYGRMAEAAGSANMRSIGVVRRRNDRALDPRQMARRPGSVYKAYE